MTNLTSEQLSAMADWELIKNWYQRVRKPWWNHPYTVIEKIWKKTQQVIIQEKRVILYPEDILRSLLYPKNQAIP